jgi:HK97 family phage major capsid protein
VARNDVDAWIPEEYGSDVLTRVRQMSGMERFARRETMTATTKHVPRSAGAGVAVVAKGDAYGEDESLNDDVVLIARKFGRVFRLAEEDLDDTLPNVIAVKQTDWATSYAKAIDNACVATTGASNGGSVPFTSVYRALSQANADTGYVAGAHIISTAGPVSYDDLSNVLSLAETGDYFDPSEMVVLAHPAYRGFIRTVKDGQGMPIFTPGQFAQGQEDRLWDFPINWSLGLKTSAANTDAPTGNPLLMIANRRFLILGDRSGPESVTVDGRDGASMLTDETLLKMRARRAFVLGHEKAAAILEQTPAI